MNCFSKSHILEKLFEVNLLIPFFACYYDVMPWYETSEITHDLKMVLKISFK